MVKYNKTGLLKLRDSLDFQYGIYTGSEYVELTEIFSELIDREIFIKIINPKNNQVILNKTDIIHREKVGKYYILKFGDVDLDNLLFNLTNTRIQIIIKSLDNNDDEEKES